MRAANAAGGRVLAELPAMVAPGVTTADLDALAESAVRDGGGEPAFKGYHGYPATICASVNEEVVHGIPSRARAGRGRHRVDRPGRAARRLLRRLGGDGAGRAGVRAAAALLRVTEESLHRDRAGAGRRRGSRTSATRCSSTSRRTGSRWSASSSATASARRCTRSRRFRTTGPGAGPRLAEGMVLAIEPMVNMGKAGGEGAGGRLDGGDARRQPVGALRAHGGGDGGRAARADGAAAPCWRARGRAAPRGRPG